MKIELTEVKNNFEWTEKEKRKNNVVMYGMNIHTYIQVSTTTRCNGKFYKTTSEELSR